MSLFSHSLVRVHPFKHRALSACVLGGLLIAGAPVQAEEPAANARWVSDSLNTYVRSGPTDGYRIVGTLASGQKLELLKTQGDYSQVRSENGDTVWIPSRDLQDVPGQAERLPQLEQKLAELTSELAGIDETWKTRVQGMQETMDARKKLIDELQTARTTQETALSQARSELREARSQLGNEQQQVLMRYMVYGGGIAGVGLFAGLILPSLLRVRRKRNDQWF
ncbi:TIGR04211 family SH3 domain-containing protein [Pseudomonas sp. RL_15y_Pfl2_60]|uniref:TIGR04211 family SH3 domain-containing protein n=1 Tax=Pseudomonas sp. RL_15y_Pfl2_60 TaxID=3088709 RepID=UPI0030DDAFB8